VQTLTKNDQVRRQMRMWESSAHNAGRAAGGASREVSELTVRKQVPVRVRQAQPCSSVWRGACRCVCIRRRLLRRHDFTGAAGSTVDERGGAGGFGEATSTYQRGHRAYTVRLLRGRAAMPAAGAVLCPPDESGDDWRAPPAAALALWRYCEESARHIFGCALGDPVAEKSWRRCTRPVTMA
jgi:hypothetical protein